VRFFISFKELHPRIKLKRRIAIAIPKCRGRKWSKKQCAPPEI
jgi:hypothetical protein